MTERWVEESWRVPAEIPELQRPPFMLPKGGEPLAYSTPKARKLQPTLPMGVAFCSRCPLFRGLHDSLVTCTCENFKMLAKAKKAGY